jgi:hypothetical protein
MNPYDDDDPFALSEEEIRRELEARAQKELGLSPLRGRHVRSTADDILDAVSGAPPRPAIPKGHCPLCNSPSKVRGPGVGNGVVRRRCTNGACRNEWPVGQRSTRVESRPPPTRTSSGPYYGEGGPPIDRNQPVHRRIAERLRRAKDHES